MSDSGEAIRWWSHKAVEEAMRAEQAEHDRSLLLDAIREMKATETWHGITYLNRKRLYAIADQVEGGERDG